jgi:hypothetical protein
MWSLVVSYIDHWVPTDRRLQPATGHPARTRSEGGLLMEHWDVIEEGASRNQALSDLPMYGDDFPEERRE